MALPIAALAGALARKAVTSSVKGSTSSGGGDFIKLDIKLDDRRIRKLLRNAPKQVKFATAKALTDTAIDVQKAEVKELHRVFKIRSLWWKKNRKHGIKVKRAVKSRLVATIHTSAHWLGDHADGGIRFPQNKHRAIPKSDRITRKKSGQVSKRWMPSNIRNKYIIEDGRNSLIFAWNKRSKQKELMYFLIPRAKIKKTFKWYRVASTTAKRHWRGNINKAIKLALETAK